eukprot:2145795-Prymnesium_polylepis.1
MCVPVPLVASAVRRILWRQRAVWWHRDGLVHSPGLAAAAPLPAVADAASSAGGPRLPLRHLGG